MPSFSRADNKLDKDFFKELQEKCAYLGISLSEKEFKRDPDKYLAAAREYDGRVKSYLFDNRERMQELQNKFAAEDNMPAFMAMGKARQTLISELHRQMLAEKTAQAGLNAANDKEIRQMATAMAAYTHENKNADEFIRTAGEKSQPAAAKAEKDIPSQTDGKNEKARRIARAFATYKDRQNDRLLLQENAKALTKKANFDYLMITLNELGLKGEEANRFRMELRRYNGSLGDFLNNYGGQEIAAPQKETAPAETARPTKETVTPTISTADLKQKEELAKKTAAEQKAKEELAKKAAAEKQAKEELAKKAAAEKQAKEELAKKAAAEQKAKEELAKKAAAEKKTKAEQRQKDKQDAQKAKQAAKEAQKAAKEKKKALAKKEKERKIAEKQARKAELKRIKEEEKARRKLAKEKKKAAAAQKKAAKAAEKRAKLQQKAEAKRLKKEQRQMKRKARLDKIKKAIAGAFVFRKKEKNPKIIALKPRYKKRNLFQRLFGRKNRRQDERIAGDNIELSIDNPERQREIAEKKAKIIAFKQKVREKGRKTMKYAAVALPLAGMTYFGFSKLQEVKPAFDFDKITATFGKYDLPNDVVEKAGTYYNEARAGLLDYDLASFDADFSWWGASDTIPIDESDYKQRVPFIQNDKLHNVPNADFFNYCFAQTNETFGGKYGITESVYKDFVRENRALVNLYKIGSYKNMSYDEARIIAKASYFDKYGIGYIQNASMASYLYYTLIKNDCDNGSAISSAAGAILDFYDVNGKSLPAEQRTALENIYVGANASPRDWGQLIAAVNATSVSQDDESKLFAALQQSQFDMVVPYEDMNNQKYIEQTVINARYAYTPTFDLPARIPEPSAIFGFADKDVLTDFFTAPTLSEQEREAKLMEEQKQKDLETFSKIYAQCSFENVVKLSYGQKREAFNDANRVLARQGVRYNINRRLYCAGMSMASFCEAYEIFKAQNPNSVVGDAIKGIIDKCSMNAHSSTGMRDVFKKHSSRIVSTKNLTTDVEDYMKKHPHAIIHAGFRRNSAGNQHYNTIFPAFNEMSGDAYTYCAYNNNHWGNENTFSRVLGDKRRARYGKSGWFVDVTAWIDDEAERRITRELQKREEIRNRKALEEAEKSVQLSSIQAQEKSWLEVLQNRFSR